MHLFAGVGGGLLADLILGHEPIVAVEWEPYACQVLRERAADGWFPGLHVWEGDVRLFDPSDYAGSVDCIHAGFPCQDISVAGKQAGVKDGTRSGLYREVLRIAGIVRPRFLFLENVSAILSNGLGTVLADLAAMGYDTRWTCLRASDVGANHQRDRWWALATMADTESERSNGCDHHARIGMEPGQVSESGNDSWPDDFSCRNCGWKFDSRRIMRFGCPSCGKEQTQVAYTNQPQREGNQRTKRIKQEYTDSSSAGWWTIEPDVGRVADGVPARVQRLKALGNAQSPLQAATAWRLLGGE